MPFKSQLRSARSTNTLAALSAAPSLDSSSEMLYEKCREHYPKPQYLGFMRRLASMMNYRDPRASDAAHVNRNVMLYWDNANPFPSDVIKVYEIWRYHCPGWNVTLFGREAACDFLREKYGGDIVRFFLNCAMPAMRADFFRVFWAISEGGIYSDITFLPKREPLFFHQEKNLTVVKKRDGNVIRNSIFFSKKDCKELKLIAYEILKAVSTREIPCIWLATGPGAWMRVLSLHETSTVAVLEWINLRSRFIKFSNYPSSTQNTDMHWKELQLRNSIYQDIQNISDGKSCTS